jgi:hypothetical protein
VWRQDDLSLISGRQPRLPPIQWGRGRNSITRKLLHLQIALVKCMTLTGGREKFKRKIIFIAVLIFRFSLLTVK